MALLTEISSQGLKQLLKKAHFISFAFPILSKSTRADMIDSYTTNLVEEKALRWKVFKRATLKKCSLKRDTLQDGFAVVAKSVLNDYENLKKSDLWLDVSKLSNNQLNNLFTTALDIGNDDDLSYLIHQCLKKKVLPTEYVLLRYTEHISSLGQAELIEKIAELWKQIDQLKCSEYCELKTLKAIALWRNDSLKTALDMIINCYRNTEYSGKECRSFLHSAFRLMSKETLQFKSEAVLICLLRSAEEIYRCSQDIFVIGCVWKNCFESDWLSDRQKAEKLFEDYEELRNIVSERTTPLCYDLLKENNVDAVHRLIELHLKHGNKDACKACLHLLFEYNYWRRDLRACGEIIRNSLELDIPLSKTKGEKIINLLLNQPSLLLSKPTVEKFVYKF